MPTLLEMFGITEAVRSGLLYHGTDADNAEEILTTDRLTASTPHNAKPLRVVKGINREVPIGFRKHEIERFDNVYGVSMTRDPNFARRWKSGQGIVFCLSEEKLRHNYRILPINYYGDRSESEEFVVGPIQPVSRYLVSIEVSTSVMQEMIDDNEIWPPGEGRYSKLVEHPLLRVNGQRWDSRTGIVSRAA
jgi:hypothetical protein